MKAVILSDIHGNASALEAVLQEIPADTSEIWVLGDIVGYYYQTHKVLQLLGPYLCKFISGNHEHILREGMNESSILQNYRAKYGSSLDIALKKLTEREISFLTTLPDTLSFDINGKEILLCHGSPWANDEYVYSDLSEMMKEKYKSLTAHLIFQGHTHYPMELKFGACRVVNPGSVGQPRNRKPGAHWVIYDSTDDSITFKTTAYSISSLLEEIELYDPQNTYLKTVLTRI